VTRKISKRVNIITYYSYKDKYVVPTFFSNHFQKYREMKYEGAFVIDPVPGLYSDTPVFALDFKSLYPSIIIGLNLSPRNLVLIEDHYAATAGSIKVDNLNKSKCVFEGGRVLVGQILSRTSEQIYPKILKILFNKRVGYKKIMEEAETEYERKAYESKQLALKIFMNTFYGALGDRTQSGIYNPLMAGIITYTGK
jgi:DNA polymerase elongation subunit (family B)